MRIAPLAIPDVKLITPARFGDARGYFSEVYSVKALAAAGIATAFVQDNQSMSTKAGTLRGLHFQKPPFAQAKLIRVVRGRIFDVAVDLRKLSPTYGQHVAVELSSETGDQLYIPEGFAHGFYTLEPNVELNYKVSDYYAPQADTGILWSDPDIGVAWPDIERPPVLSEKDALLPRLKDIDVEF